MKTFYSLLFACLFMLAPLYAGRQQIRINDNWTFRFSHQFDRKTGERVDIPHTWNAQDALSGKIDYKRGIGTYERELEIPRALEGKRLFLRFDGVNTLASVFVNGKFVGEHRGGYTAFVFEITDRVEYGRKNTLMVRVNNGEQLDVMPLVGDFNIYGGIYRDVYLLATDPVCVSPLDYASSGVYLQQTQVSEQQALVDTRVMLSNGESREAQAVVELLVKDDRDRVVCRVEQPVSVPAATHLFPVTLPFRIDAPRLWNGEKDPFLYRVEVRVSRRGEETDCIIQPLGLRSFSVDPAKGFMLNGVPYPLKGVCRHQDRAQVGNALRREHFDEDMELMREMGVNAVRLAHYPYVKYVYEQLDRHGIVAWSEIPFVGPGGYADKGFVDSEAFKANGRQQLRELIRQNYNHPSVCFWGIFNELKEAGDNPCDYIRELNDLAHREDPTRLTTAASNQQGAINGITDLIAWNRYDGWYEGMPEQLGEFLDGMHGAFPHYRIGVSEYGAGGSVYQQQDSLCKSQAVSWWHPENWQTYFYHRNWMEINQRPFVWGSFVWNMFDFGAAHRREGDRPGINDKGLVSFDRKHKKDAFYFFKANWNKSEPVLYVAERRNTQRTRSKTTIRVFSNLEKVSLVVNGKRHAPRDPDAYGVIEWENILLNPGENTISVHSRFNKKEYADQVVWWVNSVN